MKVHIALIAIGVALANCQFLDEIPDRKLDLVDAKAAPWWIQREEAKRLKCRSSCTQHSKGVRSFVNLCDDQDVSCWDHYEEVVPYEPISLPLGLS